MRIPRQTIRRARIEMVPLIDTVFLLLVFFIYAMLSMTIHRGIPVVLPKTASAVLDKKDYLSVTVTRDSEIYFNKQPVTLDELISALRAERRRSPQARVYINADRDAYHGAVVRVLDRVRRAGIANVFIETEAD